VNHLKKRERRTVSNENETLQNFIANFMIDFQISRYLLLLKTRLGMGVNHTSLGMPISQIGWNGVVNALLTMKGLQM